MITSSLRLVKLAALATTMIAALTAASCAPQPSSPQQVEASKPSVTYKYRSDQELAQASQTAGTFCNQYQAIPRAVSFANDPDGSRIVVFDCVKMSPAPGSTQSVTPDLAFNYRTDQELLDASRKAQVYCMNQGASQQMVSNIVSNQYGTKTVTFRCTTR